MARARQVASPAQGGPDPLPRPSSQEVSEPPSQPEAKKAEPPVDQGKVSSAARRLLTNGALLLILGFEGGVLLLGHPSLLNRWAAVLALFASAVALVQAIFNLVFNLLSVEIGALSAKFKEKTRTVLQSPLVTLILAVVALLIAYPSTAAAIRVLWPPPLLRILPGKGVFNSVAQALKGQGIRYVLQVKQDGKTLGTEDVTGAGSIEVGQVSHSQVQSVDSSFNAKQKEEMEGYLQTSAPEIVKKWTDPRARRFVAVPLQRGCIQLELTYQAETVQDLISRQWVRVDSKVQLVFLENKIESQGCGS